MPTGTVKFFNTSKGFGFITADEGRKDVFVPSASISAAGLSTLKTGQRVSFEETPDGKGPKATNLKLLETPRENAPARPDAAPRQDTKIHWTLYCDPSYEESEEVLTALRAAGHEPSIVDYISSPPNRDELKRLAALLRGADQSLVRKYDHLFGELRLDDRFISENDFWDAVVEHPTLINGPIVATAARACVCHSQETLESFLANQASDGPKPASQPKSLSPRLLSLMLGTPQETIKPEPDGKPVMPALKKVTAKVDEKPAQNVRPASAKISKPAKPKAPTKPKTKAKAAAGPKKAAKKPAAKTGKR
jgi:arsenate reductase (glutaredoxin)